MLFNQPLRKGDAVVVIGGEDGEPRGAAAVELFRMRCAPLLFCSGGITTPEGRWNAEQLEAQAIGMGVNPDLILRDDLSQNTHEQAVNVIARAKLQGWKQLVVVASPYHLPRVLLTFLRTILDDVPNAVDGMRLTAVAANQVRWGEPPTGGGPKTRKQLLRDEFAKIEQYGVQGHCVSYFTGLKAMETWEGMR